MEIAIKIFNRISECSHSWDELLPSGHHLKSRHLLAFENATIRDIETSYVQVYAKEKFIGLLYLQLFTCKQEYVNISQQTSALTSLAKIILPAQVPILICGHLFRINFQGFYFKQHADEMLVFKAIDLFIQQNKKTAPAGIIIKDCYEAFVDQQTKSHKYRFFNADVTMEISRRNHWLTFDHYLADLNKNYAQRARKINRSFTGIQSKELSADEITVNASVIEKLYWNVVNRQTIKLGTVNAVYFYELKTDLQENFEFHALYKDGIMVGFYTFIFYGSHMETHYIGLDYDVNKTHSLYFNILFLSVQKMIECRQNSLELGRTSKDAKVNLGAVPKQIFNYIKVTNPLVKIIVAYCLNRFNKTSGNTPEKRTALR